MLQYLVRRLLTVIPMAIVVSFVVFLFMELSPGWVLLGYLLQWANEHKRAEFDFMRGDEDYKYKFGGQNRHVMRAKVTR